MSVIEITLALLATGIGWCGGAILAVVLMGLVVMALNKLDKRGKRRSL